MRVTVRIAVVDDTKSVRDMLVAILSLDGFEVVGQGASAEDAVRIALEQRPDVMVIDYLMPDGDGIEASAKIKEELPGQPIILYTAYLDETVRKAADSAGIVCVNKAEGIEALERAISDVHPQPNGRSARRPSHLVEEK
jgi:DNA-binding NarL/FixJ family response regulator